MEDTGKPTIVDAESAVFGMRAIRAIIRRLASSTNEAGDPDEDLMFGFLAQAMTEQIDVLTDYLGVR